MLHPTHPFDVVGAIIAYEDGSATVRQSLELFAHLIETGQAWTLQGSYGRQATWLLEHGLIDPDGTITEHGEDIATDREGEFDPDRGELLGRNSDGSDRYEFDRVWY